jgi:hypothetical protein
MLELSGVGVGVKDARSKSLQHWERPPVQKVQFPWQRTAEWEERLYWENVGESDLMIGDNSVTM